MGRTITLLAAALALAAAPFSLAHDPAGTPNPDCEPRAAWRVHDYSPAPAGGVLVGGVDGSLGDCDGTFSTGEPCARLDPADPLGAEAGLCGANMPVADPDGHAEFALGGAWIFVDSGTGAPGEDPVRGSGTLYCFGAEGHHPDRPTVTAQDVVHGDQVAFRVLADLLDITGGFAPCGDFEVDHEQSCVGTCTVTFSHGLDGAYQVHVEGTQGHVETT